MSGTERDSSQVASSSFNLPRQLLSSLSSEAREKLQTPLPPAYKSRSKWQRMKRSIAVAAVLVFIIAIAFRSLRSLAPTGPAPTDLGLGLGEEYVDTPITGWEDLTFIEPSPEPEVDLPSAATLQRDTISPDLHEGLTRAASFADVAYCIAPPGPGLHRPFNCPGRCSTLGHVQLLRSWQGLGIDGEGVGAVGGYVALDFEPHNFGRLTEISSPLSTPSTTPKEASILVVFRGTYSLVDALSNLTLKQQPYAPYNGTSSEKYGDQDDFWPTATDQDPRTKKLDCANPAHNCSVHSGFLASWHSARPIVLDTIADVLSKAQVDSRRRLTITTPEHPEPIVVRDIQVVGHSLGGAAACLAGLDLVRHRDHSGVIGSAIDAAVEQTGDGRVMPALPVTVATFGEPRVGNLPFAKYVDQVFDVDATKSDRAPDGLPDRYFRVTHQGDPVPLLPPRFGESDTGNSEDETVLYAPHSHELFIVPDSGVDLQPSDVLVCKGRADELCSIGESGRNEAFPGAEGWFWRWIGRRLVGKTRIRDMVRKHALQSLWGTRSGEPAGAILVEPEGGVTIPASPLSTVGASQDRPRGKNGWWFSKALSTGPGSEGKECSDWRRFLRWNKADKKARADAKEEGKGCSDIALFPQLPAPIWHQVRAHRQYFVLFGLCVPPGWGWSARYLIRLFSPAQFSHLFSILFGSFRLSR